MGREKEIVTLPLGGGLKMFMVLIRGSKEKVIVMFLLRGMKKKPFWCYFGEMAHLPKAAT